MRRRLEAILETMKGEEMDRQRLRLLRAVTVLEQVGSAEARRLLRALARGSADPGVAEEARASLRRLGANSP
jgi:hypothetical protein